jgi:hypothetical protein
VIPVASDTRRDEFIAHSADGLQSADRVLDVLHDEGFGDLDFQPSRRTRITVDDGC